MTAGPRGRASSLDVSFLEKMAHFDRDIRGFAMTFSTEEGNSG